MFEHRRSPMITRAAFLARLAQHGGIAFGLLIFSLLLGVMGYHFFEKQSLIDSLLNASMLLGGMGPIGELHTVGGKLFASFYALYAGIVFLVIAGVLFAPVYHRFLHHFHLELEEGDTKDDSKEKSGQ